MKRKASVYPLDSCLGLAGCQHEPPVQFQAAGEAFAPGFQPQHLLHTHQRQHIPHPGAREAFGTYGCVCLIQLCIQPRSLECLTLLVCSGMSLLSPVLVGLLSSSPMLPAELL